MGVAVSSGAGVLRIVACVALLAGSSGAAIALTARGRIIDAVNHAIPDAKVAVTSSDETQQYAATVTDANGRFSFVIPDPPDLDWVQLRIEAAGFVLGRGRLMPGEAHDDTITLQRAIDAAFMSRLVAERDVAVRRDLLVQLLAASAEEEVVFPYLGQLRDDLRKVATGAPGFELAHDLTFSAKVDLLEWGSPEDAALTARA